MTQRTDLENELIYLGLLDKAREIYTELGDQAVLSYIKSSHKLLSKVYHPDLNPDREDKAKTIQQRLNRVSQIISRMKDHELIDVIENGAGRTDESRPKVLIVEDETGLQELFRKVLTMEGFTVQVAGDGETGYQAYRRFQPDLVVADVVLPVCSGIEMVRRIREENFRLKVVYMSGFFGIEGLKKDLDAEIRQYGYPTLVKPFKISALLNIVQEGIEGRSGGRFQRGV